MVEKEEIIDDDIKIAEELNNFFKNAVASLNIQENQLILTNVEQDSDPIEKAIKNSHFIQVFYLSKTKFEKPFLQIHFVLKK